MVGRNEPCPCGSGKKYKHCCLRADEAQARAARGSHEGTEFSADAADVPSFMEYLNRPSSASDLVKQFVDQRTSSINDAPIDDFEGLTSAQMHEILHAREAERVPLLRLNGSLAAADAETAPLVATIRWVLQYHADHGGTIRLTARGNYPRALCRAYLAHFVPWYREGMTVPNEASLLLLVLAHDLLVGFGWMTETGKLSEITTDGVQVLGSGGATTAFRQAFQYLLLSTDWADSLGDEYEDAATHLSLIQNAAIFSLYLLSRHPVGTVRELFDRFTRAFPDFVKPAQGDQRTVDWLGNLYADLFVDEFCVPLGLVAVTGGEVQADAENGRGKSNAGDELDRRYRTTKLFRSALGWG